MPIMTPFDASILAKYCVPIAAARGGGRGTRYSIGKKDLNRWGWGGGGCRGAVHGWGMMDVG